MLVYAVASRLLSALKLHPGVDFSRELSGILDENSLWLLDANRTNGSGPQKTLLGTPSAISPTNNTQEDYDSSEDDIASHLNLKRSMEALTLNSEYPRYLGKSSRLRFYKRACDLKSDYTGQEQRDPTLFTQRLRLSMTRNKYWKNERVSSRLIRCQLLFLTSLKWIMNALEAVDQPNYTFPEPDLLASLVDLYFTMFNVFLPLLHRPTLQACLSAGLHYEDEGFGSLILLVCAMGSRFSEDPRVLAKCTKNWHSAGWPWFSQVYAFRKAIKLKPPRLYDLQIPCVSAVRRLSALLILIRFICSSLWRFTSMDRPCRNLVGPWSASDCGSPKTWVHIGRGRMNQNQRSRASC